MNKTLSAVVAVMLVGCAGSGDDDVSAVLGEYTIEGMSLDTPCQGTSTFLRGYFTVNADSMGGLDHIAGCTQAFDLSSTDVLAVSTCPRDNTTSTIDAEFVAGQMVGTYTVEYASGCVLIAEFVGTKTAR